MEYLDKIIKFNKLPNKKGIKCILPPEIKLFKAVYNGKLQPHCWENLQDTFDWELVLRIPEIKGVF